jgi:phage protein U
MRELQGGGEPLMLVDGLGNVHGLWVLVSVEERQATFAAAGVPRRQEFSLSLKKYSDDDTL